MALFQRPGQRLAIIAIALLSAVMGLLSPFFQKVFVDRLIGQEMITHSWKGFAWMDVWHPMLLVILAFFATLFAQALGLLANYVAVREGIHYQADLSEELYKKTLSVRSDAMGSTTVGEVVSIYATDVQGASAMIDQVIPMAAGIFFPMLFAPLAIFWITGIPLSATLTVMAVMVTLNVIMASRQSRFFHRFKVLAAERTGLVNEWVQNIRLLRILGWVENYEAKIFAKREEETKNRLGMVTNGQLMNSFGSSITYVINLTGVAALIFMRQQGVTAGELFALLWIFGVFLTRPFRQTPWIFTFALDSMSSMKRVDAFLRKPSSAGGFPKESASDSGAQAPKPAALPVEIRDLRLAFGENERIKGVDFEIEAGEFVAIVGEVGAGKSLLVHSLMGETGASFGRFHIGDVDALELDLNERRKHFAFVSQEGFVMSASLRENVAFQYLPSGDVDGRVDRALKLAQFDLNTEHVDDGLDTQIGERGVNLSGGQKQRVSLARAGFFDRPIVLLDDCLSAVDVDTENKLLEDLIDGAWKDKTRILVTHRLTVLSLVDRIFFMEDGKIVESGTFDDLVLRSARVRDYVASVKRGEGAASGEAAVAVLPTSDRSAVGDGLGNRQERSRGDVKAEGLS
jgi:ATP-binding cassette, subfamily B, multidrug efflux pump